MSKLLSEYIEGLEKDRKKLLNFRNFIKSELEFEKQPKLTKVVKSEKIQFLEKVLAIIDK